MNEENFTQLAIKISSELGTLNANMAQVLGKISEHDERLRNLENSGRKPCDENLKDRLLEWCAKGLLAAIGVIAALSGAAGIIKQIFEK